MPYRNYSIDIQHALELHNDMLNGVVTNNENNYTNEYRGLKYMNRSK